MCDPLVSVVMGARNAGDELGPTLGSMLSQIGVDLEVVVVDDGSTDDTPARLAEIATCDSRVKVLTQDNQGLTVSLIVACGEARGRYIARQDIGDRSLPGRLSGQAEVLSTNPEVLMVTCGYRLSGPRREFLGDVMPPYPAEVWTDVLRSGDVARLHGPHHGTVMFRRDAYFAVGGYRPEFYFAQDLDLWTRLASKGSLGLVPDVLYEVRVSHDSISARFGAEQRQLHRLIAEGNRRRALGESDVDLLAKAAQIRPAAAKAPNGATTDMDYFVGSCLTACRDPAARHYLRRVLRERPLHGRALAKLLWSYTF